MFPMTAFVCVIQSHNILVLDIRELHLYYVIYKKERKITAFVDQLFSRTPEFFLAFLFLSSFLLLLKTPTFFPTHSMFLSEAE